MNTNTNDVAATESKRFIASSEVLSTSKLNELRIKKWSGGDEETARYLYGEFFSFQPSCKIWLFLNHKPRVEDDSHGFWRRVRVIPFNRIFKKYEQDPNLIENLKEEYSGILRWLVEGCLKWQMGGLEPTPKQVLIATKEYQAENDLLVDFISEICVESENAQVRADNLYQKYVGWADQQGFKNNEVLTRTLFGKRITDRYPKEHTNKGTVYNGIGIKSEISDEFDKTLKHVTS